MGASYKKANPGVGGSVTQKGLVLRVEERAYPGTPSIAVGHPGAAGPAHFFTRSGVIPRGRAAEHI